MGMTGTGPAMTWEGVITGLAPPSHVITGLVPVIPIVGNAALHRIGMAGTRPAMTWGGCQGRTGCSPSTSSPGVSR